MENVVVAESGDDSDDEWNYIQVNKNGEEDTENNKSTEDIVSPSPPTASIGEPDNDLIPPGESHALSQAIAESEESCAEVSHQLISTFTLYEVSVQIL